MPTYEYKCPHGHVTELVSKISDYRAQVPCDHQNCFSLADRAILTPPKGFVQGDLPGYRCPITDKPITSRREHEENLARHGCRILETGEKEAAARFRADKEAAFDAAVEKTAEEFVEKLPSAKREQLGRELESGLDVSVVRH